MTERAEMNIKNIIKKVKRQKGGSGGEEAIYNLIGAMIKASLIPEAALGCLGLSWQADLKAVLNDEDALRRVGRLYWWGED